VQILEYLDVAGNSPYRDWFESLDAQAAAKVTVALTRIELGNLQT
jgi:putative component of toxin-antitoxin plasmid stabilization module